MKWKDIYENTKQKKYCEITGIKEENIEIESNSIKVLKQKKNVIIPVVIMFLAIIIITFRKDLNALLIVLVFFLALFIGFFAFNYFKFKCLKDGLYIKFGLQEGKIPYDKLKCVYLSKYNAYNLLPSKSYNIVIRYIDGFNRIKEFTFANYFVSKEDTMKFLENFEVGETETRFVRFERLKTVKMIAKIIVFVFLILAILAFTIPPM